MQYIHAADRSNETELIAMESVNPLEGYLYIPFVVFVFGTPALFIGLLCYIQQRNRRLQQQSTERKPVRRTLTPAAHHHTTIRSNRPPVIV
ncbi:hypothetical protein M3Y98_00723000 [Aphelenchoides besseyi]|nr:hypothetical protein M3Y98_00723000 [Aphelenchoides besseyi]KAI6210217.1 hypothetical protein M3Y96_00304300 [Aphelenchoides besseyi]